jgi:hypothetical protein
MARGSRAAAATEQGPPQARARWWRLGALTLLFVPRLAWGQAPSVLTLVAPAGGKAITVGEGRVACSADGGWTLEPGGRTVRPPGTPSAPGSPATVKVAASQTDCPTSTTAVHVVATPAWPAIDPAETLFAVDEERLELRGHNLQGTSVAWTTERESGSDTCRDPRTEAGVDICTFRVPKTVSADPATDVLRWIPAGAPAGRDVEFFGADGKTVPIAFFALTPARVEVKQLAPADASVDVSGGMGLMPLVHPEVVADVDCGPTRCSLENGELAVLAPPAPVASIDALRRSSSDPASRSATSGPRSRASGRPCRAQRARLAIRARDRPCA